MSDRQCRVCEEPWDFYEGKADMAWWQQNLFLKGAGCPSCAGEDSRSNLEVLGDLRAKPQGVPAWKEPEPKTLWTCEGCGVSAGTDPEDGESLLWFGGKRTHYRHGYPRCYGASDRDEEPDGEPAHRVSGEGYCPGCAQTCSECDATILVGDAAEGLDSYDAGASFGHPDYHRKAVCIECYCHLSNADDEDEHTDTEEEGY